jgi:hypothetical protein
MSMFTVAIGISHDPDFATGGRPINTLILWARWFRRRFPKAPSKK